MWLRTGSNPEDINRFQSHTGKDFQTKDSLNKTNQRQKEKIFLKMKIKLKFYKIQTKYNLVR